ncbi:MAG: DoxX family protein [Xanthomonadales bacterium]|nr:DoxX family protein [Gammaproteobacteria bacterium]NNE06073.1 DoxX family protein [Xanthomonadales bacterium]NNL95918.1 DoxX family protein [Xanthomonadales bacterium]
MALVGIYDGISARLKASGEYVWPLALRLIMFWEFWESGLVKLRGENWFQHIPTNDWVKGFPFPVSVMPNDFNWFFATWGELVFSVMVLLGLFTRVSAFGLIIFTAVATSAVHWPADWSSLGELWNGYAISVKDGAGNYKLPLLFVLMLLPLVFHGGGKLSLDRVLLKLTGRADRAADTIGDLAAAGLALLVIGLPTVMVEEVWGITLLVLAAACLAMPLLRNRS